MATAGNFPKESGDTIFFQDYNAIRTVIEPVLTSGSGTTGYGQSLTSSNVNQYDKITEAQWDALRTDINTALIHQSGSSSLTNVDTSTTIGIAVVNALRTAAGTAVTNKDNVFAQTQSALATGLSNSYSTPWKTSIRHRVLVSFASADAARYFFNLGGNIRVTASQTGSTAQSIDLNWATLINSLGPIYYTTANYRAGGNVIIKAQTFGTSPYAANFYQAWGEKTSDTQIVLTALFNDAKVQTGFNQSQAVHDENVTLTITSAIDYYKSVGAITGPVPTGISGLAALGP